MPLLAGHQLKVGSAGPSKQFHAGRSRKTRSTGHSRGRLPAADQPAGTVLGLEPGRGAGDQRGQAPLLVRFTWDPEKSDANLAACGFDLDFATLIFAGPTLEREDTRQDYGERRVIAIGLVQGIALTVVYTDRPAEADVERRIISARRSNRRERRAYEDALKLR